MKKPFKLVMDTGKNVANVSTHQKNFGCKYLHLPKWLFWIFSVTRILETIAKHFWDTRQTRICQKWPFHATHQT
jgi:hypothetical protein